ncbi:MAG TPA: CpaF family protein [Gaiellaceae bacterium]
MELHERIDPGDGKAKKTEANGSSKAVKLHERIKSRQPQTDSEADGRPPDPFAELKTSLHLAIISELGPQLYNAGGDAGESHDRVVESIEKRLAKVTGLSHDDRLRLAGEIEADILGYGPIEQLLGDESVSEVMINGPFDIWLERDGRLARTPLTFNDASHLRRIINKMVGQVGRRIDESSPMVDARLPDGSRVNAVVPPLSLSGPLVTIRKFQHRRFYLSDLISTGTLSEQAADFLERSVRGQLNILISGGTGAGKTTLLNALSESIAEDERIVTIEDAAELRLRQEHVLRLESRPKNIEGEGEITIRDLVRNTLRMRPDRIIVGEVRGAEALDMLQAMNTGHDGSLSTIHCNSPRDALMRIETMVMMAGFDLPMRAIRQQVASALDMIVHLERMDDGSRRVTSITEVQRMEGDIISLQDLFVFRPHGESLELLPSGLRPSEDKFRKHGVELPGELFDARKRPNGVEVARR